MKHLLLLFFLCVTLFSQAQNLVPNPSFEDTVGCPDDYYQIFKCKNWNGFGGSSEYYNSCSNKFGVPKNIFGTQKASTGKCYCGSVIFENGTGFREYIGCQLLTPLVMGEKYYAGLKVCLADSANYASNNIGISFSTTSYNINFPVPINNQAKVYYSIIISDTANWSIISGAFIADSAYKYIIIGNFFDDNHTDRVYLNHSNLFQNEDAYYYIDDVFVSSDSLECGVKNNIEQTNIQSSLNIYPNPSNDKVFIRTNTPEKYRYSLISLLGEKIKSYSGIGTTELTVTDIPTGIYMIEVQSNDKLIQRKQIIIH